MSRYTRVPALILVAVAMMLAPCTPALTWSAPCAMAGCDDDAGSRISSTAPCCCATTGTPATSSTSIAGKQSPTRGAHLAAAVEPAMVPALTTTSLAVVVEPPAHVPLFLLNSSFLI